MAEFAGMRTMDVWYASLDEDQVRAEYSWVQSILFRSTRRKILEGFLQRASIYSTAHFHGRLEKKARENLARSLTRLSSG